MAYLLKNIILSFVKLPNFLRRIQWPVINRMLDLSPGDILLDIGAGSMEYSIIFSKLKSVNVIALDLDIKKERLSQARRAGVMPVSASGEALPFGNESVNKVLMSSLIHMVPNPHALLLECKRVLKDSGEIVLSCPNHYQYIPFWYKSCYIKRILINFFNLPTEYTELINRLNSKFFVGGTQGYYSFFEIEKILSDAGFYVEECVYSPGFLGSVFWELSVLGYYRFGTISFNLLLFAYPLVRVVDFFVRSESGSEIIIKARRES